MIHWILCFNILKILVILFLIN